MTRPAPSTPPARGLFAVWGGIVTARPWWTLALVAVLTAAGLSTALRLQPATGVQDMLADNQPAALALVQVLDRFALVDDLVILARLPNPAGTRPEDTTEDLSPDRAAARRGGSPPGDPERLLAFAERLEANLADDPGVADLRYRPSSEARAFVEQLVIPRGLYYLDPDGRRDLLARLTPAAMDRQFEQNAAMLAAPGPAAGRLAKELIQDPLRLRDFLNPPATPRSEADPQAPPPTGPAALVAGNAQGQYLDGVDALISRNGRAILIRIAGTQPANDLPFTADFMPRVRAAVDAANPDGLRIDYTGAYAIAEHSAAQTKADMIRSCLGSISLLIVVFLLAYRHPLAFWVLTLPVYVAIVGAFGLYVGFAGRLTPVTAVAGAVLAGLGIDYCVHYLSHYEAQRRQTPDLAHPVLARITNAALAPAIGAACLTSLIGFGAVLSSSVRSLREFAVLGMLGLGLTWFTTVTVMPALLAALGRTRLAKHRGFSETRIDFSGVVRHIAQRPRRVLLLGTLPLVLATAVLSTHTVSDGSAWRFPVRFDSDLHALHPRPHPPLEAQSTLAQIFGAAPNALMILVEADSPAAMLDRARATQDRLAQTDLPFGIAGILGPATLLPPASGSDPGPRPDPDTVAQDLRRAAAGHGFDPAAFADYQTFLVSLLTTPPPTFADLEPYSRFAGLVLPRDTPAPTQGLVLVTLAEPWATVQDRNDTIDAVREALAPIPSATLTGISVVGYDTQRAIAGNLTTLLALAAGLVLVWLAVFFRRPAAVALALLPAAAGLLILAAVAAAAGWTFNAINLIAMPLIVGIGVDDGIFLVAIARRWRAGRADRETLVAQIAASAHAITMTSLTTGLAFGSLAFTSVPAIRSLGAFTVVGVAAAWFASLLLLIPLLVGRSAAPSTPPLQTA
ncbi:MAG: MMPL family transporter [Planctomycetota bacterium]